MQVSPPRTLDSTKWSTSLSALGWGVIMFVPMLMGYVYTDGSLDGPLRALAWLMLVGAWAVVSDKWRARLGWAACLYGIWYTVAIIYTNFTVPHEWDFLCIFLDAQTVMAGLNPYEPASYQAMLPLAAPIQPTPIMHEEIIDVGFKYFPPAMLIYWPLGMFSFKGAHLIWVILNWLAAGTCAIYLHRMRWYNATSHAPAWVLTLALMLLWPATKPAVHFENSHWLMLLLALVIWDNRDHWRGGLVWTMGITLKPLFVLLGGYFFLRGRWRPMVVGILGFTLLCATVALFFSPTHVTDFINNNPNTRVPTFQYTSVINHSLLSVLVRALDFDFTLGHSPVSMPAFLVIGGFIGLFTGVTVFLTKEEYSEWGMAAIVAMTVLLYPGSLKPYAMLLLPVYMLHMRSLPNPSRMWWLLGTGIFLSLMIRYTFWTNLWLWGYTMWVMIRKIDWQVIRKHLGQKPILQ